MERVIFRTERNEYVSEPSYLACFPDDPANPGRICCTPFYFLPDGTAIFESYCEASLGYYYDNTRIVHKTSQESEKLLSAIERYYDTKFKIVEKITH